MEGGGGGMWVVGWAEEEGDRGMRCQIDVMHHTTFTLVQDAGETVRSSLWVVLRRVCPCTSLDTRTKQPAPRSDRHIVRSAFDLPLRPDLACPESV